MDEGTEQAGSSRRFLWVAGAAKEFGISTPGVKRLIRSGALPTIEMGEAVRIPLAAIDRLVQGEAHKGERGDVRGVVDALATLDELRAGQAELLREVQRLREDVAGFLK
jgi:excisionase family DNA binding protein